MTRTQIAILLGLLIGFLLGLIRWHLQNPLRKMPKEPPLPDRRRTYRNVAIGYRAHAADLFQCRPDEVTEAMLNAAKRDLHAAAYNATRETRQMWLDTNPEVPPATLPVPRSKPDGY